MASNLEPITLLAGWVKFAKLLKMPPKANLALPVQMYADYQCRRLGTGQDSHRYSAGLPSKRSNFLRNRHGVHGGFTKSRGTCKLGGLGCRTAYKFHRELQR